LDPTLERIRRVADLAKDWDSYGALPPSREALANSRWILSKLEERLPEVEDLRPFALSPLADGGMQLEWERPGLSLELEINSDGSYGYLLVEGEGQARRSTEKDNADFEEVIGVIRRAVGSPSPG